MQFFTRIAIAVALLSLPACGGTTETKTTKTVTKTVTPPPVKDVKTDVTTETKTETKTETATPPVTADKGPPAADSPEGRVLLAATVAREISGAPDRADEILGKHGLDRDRLDALMFEIASDPALTSAYMAARRTS
ncbi:MAG: hypothetical protein H0T76_23165 [Nannocystis sp.]|nr:hypothetical protein [Nannocystis sp.]MBA3549385.1 hypothetical protein [Nannocystis sp.]